MTTVNRGDFGIDTNATGDADQQKIAAEWTTQLGQSFSDKNGFLSGLSNLFNERVVVKKGALDKALEAVTSDASNPKALADYQAALSEYTLYRNAQSNAVKAYKDVDANTIRNFN